MKIVNKALELRAIRTLASSNTKISSMLLALLDERDFHSPAAQQMFRRISSLAKKRGRTAGWEDLITDPSIDELVRKQFAVYKKKPWGSLQTVKDRVSKLHEYRRLRQAWELAEYITKTCDQPSVDTEKLFDDISDRTAAARMGGDVFKSFINVGGDDRTFMRTVKKILKGQKNQLIPTGFNAFDSVNGGIFRGSVWTIAATTGGGKSTLAQVVAINMARFGARVGMASLEMSGDEMVMRMMSNLSSTDMQKITKPENMSKQEKRHVYKKSKEFNAKIKAIKSLYSIITPDEDVSMEELLMMCKSYAYDVIIIDYINLLKGMDEEQQWRKLGAAARFAKRFALVNNCVVVILAQLSDEGNIRYSKAVQEHSNNMWQWVYGPEARDKQIIEVRQTKARNQRPFPFFLKENFGNMQITDFEGAENYRRELESNRKEEYSKKKKGYGNGEKKRKYRQDGDVEDTSADYMADV